MQSSRQEFVLGIILITVSVLSILYYEHGHQVKLQQYLRQENAINEEKQFVMAMYNEIRKAICSVAHMEQLLPISKRSFMNITYPCPISV